MAKLNFHWEAFVRHRQHLMTILPKIITFSFSKMLFIQKYLSGFHLGKYFQNYIQHNEEWWHIFAHWTTSLGKWLSYPAQILEFLFIKSIGTL